MLQGVSRTFALTIPQLPPALSKTVSNAYLLCRIADTIEDEATLSAQRKQVFSNQFQQVVAGHLSPEVFAAALHPLLSANTIAAEHELIRRTAEVIQITHSLASQERAALERCVSIMGEGMTWFQLHQSRNGLPDLAHLDAYCYYVAGVVGEMLTQLFCHYSPAIDARRQQMLALAVSFGQGLQMTNILKDIWEDHDRGVCWLPRNLFARNGFDLAQLNRGTSDLAFAVGLGELVAIAHGHLRNALSYALLIPKQEKGLRKFCLLAIGMAVLTLRKIHMQRDFLAGRNVKISRRSVAATVMLSNALVSSDTGLRLLFNLAATGLPPACLTPPVNINLWQKNRAMLPD
ncbi:MAG: phytoene/squalene synthase family protein [Burkholderiaceae bacterium]